LPTFLEFFAGSGLVAEGMKTYFLPAWANDICEKKASVYHANIGKKHFKPGSIADFKGKDLPCANLAWASFPCQDLSLAGNMDGLDGKRSGLVWQWLRILDEMPKKPQILVAENVEGLVSSDGGAHYKALHKALSNRGYKTGAVLLDAVKWVPQSRPRIFVISVPNSFDTSKYSTDKPTWAHSASIEKAAKGLKNWVWWNLPEPAVRKLSLVDIIEEDEPHDDEKATKRNLQMLSPKHQAKLIQELANGFKVAPGYKRTRNGKQMLELRFDNVAGCLRTPEGGSSRQLLVIKKNGQLVTRLLTIRETARLMGVRDTYKFTGTYNDGYKAMGDAVAVPVVRHLAKHLLKPLEQAMRQLLLNLEPTRG